MNLLVLTYHYFHHDRPTGIKKEDHAFSIGLDRFSDHCAAIVDSGYKLIDPERLTRPDEFKGDPDRQILVTIDDGHQSLMEAAEILAAARITPVINIIPGLVGHEQYLNWSQLRELALQGFCLQSHSMSHHDLTKLSDLELDAELRYSKTEIEDNIGLPVTMVTAPMGRIDQRVVGAAGKAGYEVIMTSYTGINQVTDDLKFLRRFQVKRNRAHLNLDAYYKPFSPIRLMGAAKNAARKLRHRLK